MTTFPITVGRKNQVPPPNIIFGGVSVHREHAQFIMLPNGLIKLEVNATNEKAVAGTLVNGCPLRDGSSQILHHLDTIYFGPG
jgi:pSer/pThr/pTyr-binding forkhead associated (FHA) protein